MSEVVNEASVRSPDEGLESAVRDLQPHLDLFAERSDRHQARCPQLPVIATLRKVSVMAMSWPAADKWRADGHPR